jgi:hypothetical protein
MSMYSAQLFSTQHVTARVSTVIPPHLLSSSQHYIIRIIQIFFSYYIFMGYVTVSLRPPVAVVQLTRRQAKVHSRRRESHRKQMHVIFSSLLE